MSLLRRFLSRWKAPKGPHGQLQHSVGHIFERPELLDLALAHRSWVNSAGRPSIESNERLEFLGDAVLDMVITDYLFSSRPTEDEGKLSKIKSLVVSARVLAEVARTLDLGKYLALSKSEERGGGRDRESILADAFESVIGAIYLDAGYDPARDFLFRTLISSLDSFLGDAELANYKSALLEHSQGKGWGAPQYEIEGTQGPEHGKRYHVAVRVRGEFWGRGNGASKKDAEQAAARDALQARGIEVG